MDRESRIRTGYLESKRFGVVLKAFDRRHYLRYGNGS